MLCPRAQRTPWPVRSPGPQPHSSNWITSRPVSNYGADLRRYIQRHGSMAALLSKGPRQGRPGDRAGLPVRWASPAMRPTPPAPRRRAPPQLGRQMCAYPFPSTQPPPTRPSRSAGKGPTTPDPYRLGRNFLLRLAETNPSEAPPGPARSFEAEQPFEVPLSTQGSSPLVLIRTFTLSSTLST